MSYIDLKHLLADLALGAIRHPAHASWAPLVTAYGGLANLGRAEVEWTTIRERAHELGARFGWRPAKPELARLVQCGLFEEDGDFIRIHASFVRHLGYLRQQATRLLDALWEVKSPRPSPSVPDVLRRGVVLFNTGLFFECHEWLEDVWRATGGPAKNFYHGIVQVAAAFYHYEKRNLHGAETLLKKGMRRLVPYPAVYLGIDVAALREALQLWAEHFEARTERIERPGDYPRIELTERASTVAR